MRLIDADELKKELKDNHLLTISGYRVKLDDIDDIPTIQAVPIEVLDKIRAEIEEKRPLLYPFVDHKDEYLKRKDVLQIINKYRKGDTNE